MTRFFFQSQSAGNWSIWLGIVASLVFLLCQPALAQNLTQNLEVKLGIEIGDELLDYGDADKTVPKGRFVTYQIQLANKSDAETLHGMTLLFEQPVYLNYITGSTFRKSNISDAASAMTDINNESPLFWGTSVDSLAPGESTTFTLQFQVTKQLSGDQNYTLAWASVIDPDSGLTRVSNTVENRIFGESVQALQVKPEVLPAPGTNVNLGSFIYYNYQIHNVGGEVATAVRFIPQVPAYTSCRSGCETQLLGEVNPNEMKTFTLAVEVGPMLEGATEIRNTGFDIAAVGVATLQNREPIIHPTDGTRGGSSTGEFRVTIDQRPNLILNSPNGAPRADRADRTETKYTLFYTGRKNPITYPVRSAGDDYLVKIGCFEVYYPQVWHSKTVAYNSYGAEGCEDINLCPIYSSPIVFTLETILPANAPKLIFTQNIKTYTYGDSISMINNFMKNGGTHLIPIKLTESRAVENGSSGVVETTLTTTVMEDYWSYEPTGATEVIGTCSCGDDCEYDVERPLYAWQKQSLPFSLTATDVTGIAVYTSTAWLKTKDGHLGTNDRFTNGSETQANYVDLGVPEFSNHLTPSSLYTPPGEYNAEGMIFAKNGAGQMTTKAGEPWKVTGTDFAYPQRGDAYDRSNNPRDYTQDLLEQEKFGPVEKDRLPSTINGTLSLGDGKVWSNSGSITFGRLGVDDTVTLSGGQARIYTDGDVTINANLKFQSSSGAHLGEITSVRIDARNIYISGEVTDVQAFLTARGEFHTGKSHQPLHLLGDVIAGQTFWERGPLMQEKPEEFNQPSETVIEDLRKYVAPPTGDTELPEDYTLWRQVNPATGETVEGF